MGNEEFRVIVDAYIIKLTIMIKHVKTVSYGASVQVLVILAWTLDSGVG